MTDQLRVANPDLVGVMAPHHFQEKLLQWMIVRNHRAPPT